MRYAKYFDKDLYSKWHRTIDNNGCNYSIKTERFKWKTIKLKKRSQYIMVEKD